MKYLPTAAKTAEATSVIEEELLEATSGMAEDTAIGACAWAASLQPVHFLHSLSIFSCLFYGVEWNHEWSPEWEKC